jgi:hypothetical protein
MPDHASAITCAINRKPPDELLCDIAGFNLFKAERINTRIRRIAWATELIPGMRHNSVISPWRLPYTYSRQGLNEQMSFRLAFMIFLDLSAST